jgi:hypothetical protein
VKRFLALLVVAAGLAPGTWWRQTADNRGPELELRTVALDKPDPEVANRHIAPFRLEGAWHLTSPRRRFGGFSALLPPSSGRLTAFSDKGFRLHLSLPGPEAAEPQLQRLYRSKKMRSYFNDVEAATRDPETGRVWLSAEGRNAILRFGPDLRFEKLAMPQEMRSWGANSGAEAMTRLPDGRFVLLRESFTSWFEDSKHDALIFDGDPVEGAQVRRFTMAGPANFSPVDMTLLPDGRLLVLMRRLVWPFPARFAGSIAIGDPEEIAEGKIWQLREVARLTSSLPADNFEGMAVEPGPAGELVVWLISDDNNADFQRTLLWKLAVDPADLAR